MEEEAGEEEEGRGRGHLQLLSILRGPQRVKAVQ